MGVFSARDTTTRFSLCSEFPTEKSLQADVYEFGRKWPNEYCCVKGLCQGTLANYIQQSLPSLFFHCLERTLESPRDFIWFLNAFRVSAAGLCSELKLRRGTQIAAGKIA